MAKALTFIELADGQTGEPIERLPIDEAVRRFLESVECMPDEVKHSFLRGTTLATGGIVFRPMSPNEVNALYIASVEADAARELRQTLVTAVEYALADAKSKGSQLTTGGRKDRIALYTKALRAAKGGAV